MSRVSDVDYNAELVSIATLLYAAEEKVSDLYHDVNMDDQREPETFLVHRLKNAIELTVSLVTDLLPPS